MKKHSVRPKVLEQRFYFKVKVKKCRLKVRKYKVILLLLLHEGCYISHKIISQYFKEICNNDDMSEYKKIKLVGGCSLQMAVFISAKKMKGISILPTYCD